MKIIQFEDKNLAQYSYAILSNKEIALVDPARDPQPYYNFAALYDAKITAIIETHPHADFVSGHLEISNTTGATIYVSKLLGAEYPHAAFDEGNSVMVGSCYLKSLNTPGHSPDSISIVAIDENENTKAVFTGDTLFIGDCGRPDLRENAGNTTALRADLAKQMYHSLRDKLMKLPDDVLVYPAHGAGSLCGKGLSEQNTSTIRAEKLTNWSLQEMGEDQFVKELLTDQPFIPKYFTFDVAVNKKGAEPMGLSLSKIKIVDKISGELDPNILVIDSRPQSDFKRSHRRNSINLMDGTKFETWLGSIVSPNEKFYLLAGNRKTLDTLIQRTAKIGYESQIEMGIIGNGGDLKMDIFETDDLIQNEDAFTIVDIRNGSEVKSRKIFANAIHIPLHQLRERTNELPIHKPIVVHCAGGYRSAAGSSIIQSALNGKVMVYDLSDGVKKFQI